MKHLFCEKTAFYDCKVSYDGCQMDFNNFIYLNCLIAFSLIEKSCPVPEEFSDGVIFFMELFIHKKLYSDSK